MSDTAPVIETRGLTCRYGRTEAVHDVSLRVAPGTVCALLGHNGAGKSTLMHALLAMLRPSRGEALVFGKPARTLTEFDRTRIGWVADNHDLPQWMTVDQYLRFLQPMYPGWDEVFCGRLKALFALPAGRKIKHLSRGQRMKTAFLGALSYHPRLLLLDEPFSGLDPAVREDLFDAIMDLTQQEEWTVLLSSHDMDEVERLADSIAVMQEGRLLFQEDTASLLARCRAVRLAWPGERLPAVLPKSWASVKLCAGEVQFVDTAFDGESLPAAISANLPGAGVPEITRASLKTLCAALIRTRSNSSAS